MAGIATGKFLHPHRLYIGFKYLVYGLLSLNIALFFREEWHAVERVFTQGLAVADIISAFAATIDTAAWVVLLLLFELETFVISDTKLANPRLKWTLHGVRAIAYLFIVYAFYGYCTKVVLLYGLEPFPVTDPCVLANTGFARVVGLDKYVLINAHNCHLLEGAELLKLYDQQIVATLADWRAVQKLTWVDVVNAGDWLIIVLVLEIDVRLQLRGALKGWLLKTSKVLKGVLYSVLFLAAAYWGVEGDFLDFWDAFLWLVAFAFIEMNLFQWQAETNPSQLVSSSAN